MKLSRFNFSGLFLLLVLLFSGFNYYWGFEAHRVINRKAVFSLPPEMFGFYKEHIQYIEEHAVDPDKRKHTDPDEAVRHYVDIDYYAEPPLNPFDSVPQYWKKAIEKYSEDTLKKYGIVPWQVEWVMRNLTQAFSEKNTERILLLSADLGHYVADAHVPLHTTLNYNGQLTGQEGVHSFWETRLVELYLSDFDLLVDEANYISNINQEIWTIVKTSHQLVPELLMAEKLARESIGKDQLYTYSERGTTDQKVPSIDYSKAFNDRLNGMVEKQLSSAIHAVSSFWYTAWINAGQPELQLKNHNSSK